MNTWNTSYRDWLILVIPHTEGWAIWCLPPSQQQAFSDWEVYNTVEAAIAGAKEYVDRAIAMYLLADVMLDLYESGKIEHGECYSLLLSLGYAE